METDQKAIRLIVDKIMQMVYKSLIDNGNKIQYVESLDNIDTIVLEQGYGLSNKKLTNLDMKYIICFAIDMNVKDISLLFNVEPASVRTVRYRIKKKIGEQNIFKLLI